MVCEKIKYLRKASGLTQSDLAKELGVSYPTISNYETGSRTGTIENLVKIADYFNISLDWLLGRDTSKDISPTSSSLEELRKQLKIEKLKKELEELQS